MHIDGIKNVASGTEDFLAVVPSLDPLPLDDEQVTLVDFTVTQKGLEEQLLGRVIGKEQKALEEQLSDVLEEVNSNTKVPMNPRRSS